MYQCGYCELMSIDYDSMTEHEKDHERIINNNISNSTR